MQLLPVLLPTGVYKVGRKLCRPSHLELRRAFIDVQPVSYNDFYLNLFFFLIMKLSKIMTTLVILLLLLQVPDLFKQLPFVLFFLQVGTNLAEYLTKAPTEYPFVLMLGDGHQCSQAFVVINGTALEHPSLGAVDVCFKAFFVFDIAYPKVCSKIWEFIQTALFEIPGQEANEVKILRAQFNSI